MGEVLIGWQVQTGLHVRVLERVIVFASHDERQSCKIRDDDSITVLAVESCERPLFGVLVRLEVGFNDGHRPAQFDAVLSVNRTGVFLCGQAVAPVMIKKGWGRILNASSVVGLYGNFGQSNYVATKAGVIGLTKVWARELGPKGITVNAVAPGFIATEMVRQMPEHILKSMVERTPVRRMGEPRDVANAYLFLASDEASFINGAVLSVDGGVVVGT